jgi:hypothetical protein
MLTTRPRPPCWSRTQYSTRGGFSPSHPQPTPFYSEPLVSCRQLFFCRDTVYLMWMTYIGHMPEKRWFALNSAGHPDTTCASNSACQLRPYCAIMCWRILNPNKRTKKQQCSRITCYKKFTGYRFHFTKLRPNLFDHKLPTLQYETARQKSSNAYEIRDHCWASLLHSKRYKTAIIVYVQRNEKLIQANQSFFTLKECPLLSEKMPLPFGRFS